MNNLLTRRRANGEELGDVNGENGIFGKIGLQKTLIGRPGAEADPEAVLGMSFSLDL